MSQLPEQLADRDLERRTREGFTAAAEASLLLVREAAATGALHDAAGWPTPAHADGWHAPRRNPAVGSLSRAVEAGWLVAPGSGRAVSDQGRLAGLRVAVKDVIDVAGLPTRNGTPGGSWRRPDRSAAVWQRLADEGALCVGKAATHELAWGVTTATVPHPLDPARLPGGSSGGSAACVAAGQADAALGTDTGGSIRIPAALCGVVGLRPTVGSVPLGGITPLAPTQDVAGPLAHDVDTCGALAEALLGRPLARRGTTTGRLGYLATTGPLDDPTANAWQSVLEAMRRAGVELVPVEEAPLRLAGAVSLLTMLWESAQAHAASVTANPAGFGGEARALATLGVGLEAEVAVLGRARDILRDRTARLFADHGIEAVLNPTTACVAPHRDATTVQLGGRRTPVPTALTRFTAWAAATGLPAISVPVATQGALPVGIQVMAVPSDEATCLAVARLLEPSSGVEVPDEKTRL